jgi:hypothetical protein
LIAARVGRIVADLDLVLPLFEGSEEASEDVR